MVLPTLQPFTGLGVWSCPVAGAVAASLYLISLLVVFLSQLLMALMVLFAAVVPLQGSLLREVYCVPPAEIKRVQSSEHLR